MDSINKVRHFLSILVSLADRENQLLYLVGGTVRDFSLGKTSADYDFTAIDAPRLAKIFANNIQCPLVPLDDTPGQETFRVVVDKSLYFDFSRMQGKTLEDDLRRRDFTFNAMAISLKDFLEGNKSIYDPHHGIEDLRNHIIRVLPGKIFSDDPLRMVRAFRFASVLSFTIEPETLAKITECKSQLERIASERIYYELSLFLSGGNVYPLLVLMDETGLFDQLFPELSTLPSNPDGLIARRQTFHTFQVLESLDTLPGFVGVMVKSLEDKKRSCLKLAAILHRLPDPTVILKRLRASNTEISFIEKTITGQDEALHDFESFNLNHESRIYRFVKLYEKELIPALLLALGSYCARNKSSDLLSNPFAKAVSKAYDFYLSCYLPAQKLPALMNGDDLINQFSIAPSPRFKIILDQIEENRVLGIIKTRKEAETLAKKLIDNK